jgi:hypothetical protein
MAKEPTTTQGPTDDPERRRHFEALLGADFQALEAGQSPDRRELLARHPDLAPGLAEFFAEQDRFHRRVAPLRPKSIEPRAAAPEETQDHPPARTAVISRRCRIAITAGILAIVLVPMACAPQGPKTAPLSKEAQALFEGPRMPPPKKLLPRRGKRPAGRTGREADLGRSPTGPVSGRQ